MNILHVTPTFWPATYWGGPIVSTYGLCNGVAAIPGTEIRVLTTDAAGPYFSQRLDVPAWPTLAEGGYDIYYTSRLFGPNVAPGLWLRLWNMVRWADIVHLTAVYSFSTIPTLLVCRLLGKPVVWSPRGSLQPWKGRRRQVAKAIWNRACQIIAPSRLILHATSDAEATAVRKSFPKRETVVVPNGVEIPAQSKRRIDRDIFRMLFLGRLHPAKGIDNLLQACKLLHDSAEFSWALTIAGEGDEAYRRTLQEQIGKLGLTSHIVMVDAVAGNRKSALFKSVHVLVLPSHTENFGIVVAESLAHATPVIAATGTPWERVAEKQCGLWVENDPASLCRAIQAMRALPNVEMGQRGRTWMQQEFGWQSQCERMMDVYRRIAMVHPSADIGHRTVPHHIAEEGCRTHGS